MLFTIYKALKKGASVSEISEITGIDEYFIQSIAEIADIEKRLLRYKGKLPIEPLLIEAKKQGFSDKYLADFLCIEEAQIREERMEAGIIKGWEAIGENQRFSTYTHHEQRTVSDKKKIIVIGSGANKIGQGMEYDYCAVKAAQELKKLGYEAIVINCNPTASSVSAGIYDKVYFEPITLEDILSVYELEKPEGIIAEFCGGNVGGLIDELEKSGVNILGANAETVRIASNVHSFAEAMAELNILIPQSEVSGDMEEAIETVIAGYQRKNAVVSPRDKLTVSYHECGHALVAAKLKNSAPVQKITIIPRTSGALGYTMQVDDEERLLMTREQILDKITTFCGGRAAEQLIFGRITSGASNDIEQATKLARAMITRLGMSDTFGMMALETQSGQYLSGDSNLVCSDQTAARIDVEVKQIIANCYEQAYQILSDNKEKLHETAKVLLEKETITGMEFMAILAPNQLPSAETEKAEEKPEEKPDDSADDVEVK